MDPGTIERIRDQLAAIAKSENVAIPLAVESEPCLGLSLAG